jgi:hypothetical protein
VELGLEDCLQKDPCFEAHLPLSPGRSLRSHQHLSGVTASSTSFSQLNLPRTNKPEHHVSEKRHRYTSMYSKLRTIVKWEEDVEEFVSLWSLCSHPGDWKQADSCWSGSFLLKAQRTLKALEVYWTLYVILKSFADPCPGAFTQVHWEHLKGTLQPRLPLAWRLLYVFAKWWDYLGYCDGCLWSSPSSLPAHAIWPRFGLLHRASGHLSGGCGVTFTYCLTSDTHLWELPSSLCSKN